MKYVIAIWALPLVLFWGWFGLSYFDINFGYVMLTRQVHDLLFGLYADMLGIEAAAIPWLVAKACIFDTLLILAIYAFRRRKPIAAWFRALRARYRGASPARSTWTRSSTP